MRPRVVVAVLAVGLLLLGFSFYFTRPSRPLAVSPSTETPDSSPVGGAASPAQAPGSVTSPSPATPHGSPAATSPVAQPASTASAPAARAEGATPAPRPATTQRAADIRSRITTLRSLATRSDAASLETILAELNNPEKAVRAEALDAVVEFASSNAIPRLREIAAATEDPREKVALLDAAEFLALPSLAERRSKLRQKRAASLTPPATPPAAPDEP